MATIHEVAQAAGVSISTVSYALSGKRRVSDATRLRIEATVRELGYQPDAGARMLAGRRTHIFALTEPLRADTHAPTHMAFVLAVTVAARRRDYDVLLLTDEQASDGMRRVTESNLVDAILVLDVAPDDDRAAIARTVPTPTVFIGLPDDQTGLTCVDLDFEAAGRMAVDRLADAGTTAITLIGQTEVSYRKSNFPARLLNAVRTRAGERDIAFQWAVSGETTTDPARVRADVTQALERGDRAFIVHGADDVHEILLEVLSEHGLALGRDVSVVSAAASFDSGILSTPLDTIPLIPQQSCELAVDIAVQMLDDGPLPARVHLIPPEYRSAGTVVSLE